LEKILVDKTKPINVLLIGNNTDDDLAIKNILSKAENILFSVNNADILSSGLNWITERVFDIVLLDLSLPGSTGINTFGQVHAEIPDIPVIVLTGLEDEAIGLKAIKMGAQDYLIKDKIDYNILVSSIRYAIERKRSEKAIQQSEEKYRTLIELIPDIIYKLDPEGFFTFISNSVRYLGFNPADLIGKHFSEIIHPDDIKFVSRSMVLPQYKGKKTGGDKAPKLFDERRSGRRMTKNLEVRLNTKNLEKEKDRSLIYGSILFLGEITSTGVWDENIDRKGIKFTGSVGVIRDVTERKLAEEEKKNLEKQLLQSQKMEAVGHLAAGIAHDFNNILAPIIGEAQLSRDILKKDYSPEELNESLNNIIESSHRAKELVHQMLGFARQGKYNPQDIDINFIIKEVSGLLRKGFASTTHHILKWQTDAKEYINADGTQIHQIISNLAINAKDAMPDGGAITLTSQDITVKKDIVSIYNVIPEGSYVKLSVSDTGSGIKEENLTRIFDPFYTTKGKDKGTGLGLATVYGIVQNHHAYIAVESEENKGTTFSIFFPAVKHKEKLKVQKDETSIPDVSGRILIVDDEAAMIKTFERYFRRSSYDIVTASNGFEGFNKFRKGGFDLVLTDLLMSPMGGAELYYKIKELDPNAKVYIMSGYHKDEKVQQLLKDGAAGFITKPFDFDELGATIASVLSKRVI